MKKEPDKRISFPCQWQTYQYGTAKPTAVSAAVGFVVSALPVQ